MVSTMHEGGVVEGFKTWRERLMKRKSRIVGNGSEPITTAKDTQHRAARGHETGEGWLGMNPISGEFPRGKIEQSIPASNGVVSGTGKDARKAGEEAGADANTHHGRNCSAPTEDPWPFYRIMKLEKREWPSVGWAGGPLSVEDKDFRKDFRFYMYDDKDEFVNTSQVEKCYRDKAGIKQDMSNIDSRIPVFKRMYAAELAIWPVLRTHALRTNNPKEASLFIISYSPFLAEGLKGCPGVPPKWDDAVAAKLKNSQYFQRKGGQDHLIFVMRFGARISKPMLELLNAGSLVVTTDRYFWNIIKDLPGPFKTGSVVLAPYVSPFYLDHKEEDGDRANAKQDDTWYFFAGTYQRRFGNRGRLSELAEHLTSANFTDLRIPKTVAPGNGLAQSSPEIVESSAAALKRSSVCMSPQGDAITSGRLFDSLAGGCVPIVIAPKDKMSNELPLPSLIDWDAIALFTDNFDEILKEEDGMRRTGAALEALVGPKAGEREKKRLACMQRQGKRTFFNFLSYFRNPLGLTEGLLFESWILMQKRGVIAGPYAAPGTVGGKGKWVAT